MKKKILTFLLMSILFSIPAVEVFASEKVYKSDIAVLIDDLPVESVVINDEIYIDIETLGTFGFEVVNDSGIHTLVADSNKYTLNFLPVENINILKNSVIIEELGETEQTGVYFQTHPDSEFNLYNFKGDYLIRLRDLVGTYGSLNWDSENRRVYFYITEFIFARDFKTGLDDSSISEDERLGLVVKNDKIASLTYNGQVKDFKVNGIGIIQADYKNGERIITKSNFPNGYAEGRLISCKYSSDKLLSKLYAGVDNSKINGAYLYIDYSDGFRIEGNYEFGMPDGEQRKGIMDNKYLYGYKVINNNSDNLKIYNKPFEKLISFSEISENEYND